MSDEKIKISQLPPASEVSPTAQIPILQDGVTKRAAIENLPFGTDNVNLTDDQTIAGVKTFEDVIGAELGIAFGAGGSNKTLDDYEKGTWTPTLSFTNTTGTIGYSQRVGTYVKFGDMVFIQMLISLSEYLGANSGFNRIQGLPFVPNTNTDFVFACMFQNIVNFDGVIGVRLDSVNQVRVCKIGTNSVSIPENNAFANNSVIRCAMAYRV